MESVVETATDLRTAADEPWNSGEDGTNGYFSAEEARIVDNIVLDIPTSAPSGHGVRSSTDIGGSSSSSNSTINFADDGDNSSIRIFSNGTISSSSPSSSPRQTQQRQQQQQRYGSAATELGRKRSETTTFVERARRAIRRSIMRSTRAVPSMRFPQMVACGFVFACRAITTNPWCGAASFVGAR